MSKKYLDCFPKKKLSNIGDFWGNSKNFIIINLIIEDDICAICQSRKREKTQCDNCPHTFCFNCILAWVRINNICPLCKARVMKLTKI